MITSSTCERALHQWEPWLRAVKEARAQRHPNSEAWCAYAKTVMRGLRLPGKPLLCLYYVSCVQSQYEMNGVHLFDRIRLPPVMYDEFNRFEELITPAVFRFLKVDRFMRREPIELCPDLMGMRDRPLPPAIWNDSDVEFAIQWEADIFDDPAEALQKYYSPFFMLLPSHHPLREIAGKLKRQVDPILAIRCAEMMDNEGLTLAQIAEAFGFARQEDSYGKLTRSSTARRYVRLGRKLIGGR